MAILCKACLAFQNWDLPRSERWSGAKFAHHQNAMLLHKAAIDGCHVCNLIEYALIHNSERPEGEDSLPNGQIWLECCEADIVNPSTVLKINIEPDSLATAGCRDIDQSEVTIASLVMEEIDEATQDMMRGEATLGFMFWIIRTDEGVRLFYGDNEIYNEDLFFALANPYYQATLEFACLPDPVTQMLSPCRGAEDKDTGSEASFKLISGWLNICLETHTECNVSTDVNPLLPTRVLDIGAGSETSEIALLVTAPGQRGTYAALSHRWGETKPLITTKDNLSARQRSIVIEDMSQTFRDAILTTKKLGLQYLWIDSLCIIQDSREDWEREASQMASIYRNARITIAAVDAEDDKAGCFSPRNGLARRPCRIDIDVSKATFPNEGQIYLSHKSGRQSGFFRPRGPIDTRAWVLQEQLLSPRIINFKSDGVYWECLETEASETLPEGIQAVTGDAYAEDIDFVRIFKRATGGSLDLSSPESRAKLHRSWQLVVQAYSRRILTKETDKLAALLGIIYEIGRCTSDRVVCGLCEKFLPMDLLWCVYGPGCPTIGSLLGYSGRLGPPGVRLGEHFRAPSWSWLNIRGNIRYIESYVQNPDDGEILTDCQLVMADPKFPKFKNGSREILKLKGPTRVAIAIAIEDKDRVNNAILLNNTEAFTGFLTSKTDQQQRLLSEANGPVHSTVGQEEEPKTWREAQEWFRNINRKNKWVARSTDPDYTSEEVVHLEMNQVNDIALRAAATASIPMHHADFLADVNSDAASVSVQYALFQCSGRFEYVGVWAPDVQGEIPVRSAQELMADISAARAAGTGPFKILGIDFTYWRYEK